MRVNCTVNSVFMPRERYVPGGQSCSLKDSCSEGKDINAKEMKELGHY